MAKETTHDIFKYVDEDYLLLYDYGADVYVCSGCETDIVHSDLMISVDVVNDSCQAVCTDSVNIRHDPWNLVSTNKRCPVQRIFCKVCGLELGFEWVRVKDTLDMTTNKGRFLLFLDKLILRVDGQFYDAITAQPLHRNAFHDRFMSVKDGDDVFECYQCETTITPYNQWIRRYFQNGRCYTLFGALMNITYDECVLHNSENSVRSIYCKKCHSFLGYNLITVVEPGDDVENDRFLVFTDKLRLIKGGYVLDAATEEPMYEDSSDAATEEPYEDTTDTSE